MTYDEIEGIDGDIDFAIRECTGGWIVKYLEGVIKNDDGATPAFSERVFVTEEALSEFVLQWATGMKRVRAEAISESPLNTSFANRVYNGKTL